MRKPRGASEDVSGDPFSSLFLCSIPVRIMFFPQVRFCVSRMKPAEKKILLTLVFFSGFTNEVKKILIYPNKL